MTTIDLGVNFEDVKDADKFPVLPNGTYQFTVAKIDLKASGPASKIPGRPMLVWTLTFTHPESGQKVNIFHNSVLPWLPPGQSELDISGVGMLVGVCKAVGLPWAGAQIDPTAYLGRSGHAVVSQRTKQIKDPAGTGLYVDDPNGAKNNNIDSFVN